MGSMTPTQLTEIKTRIRNEMLRRNGYGSVATYGASKYDFTETPKTGEIIKAEVGEKTINLLRKVETKTFPKDAKAGEAIPDNFDYETMKTLLSKLENEKKTGNASGYYNGNSLSGTPETSTCEGACTGLCVGACSGACNGCSTTCGGSCSTGCSTGCKSSCTGQASVSVRY